MGGNATGDNAPLTPQQQANWEAFAAALTPADILASGKATSVPQLQGGFSPAGPANPSPGGYEGPITPYNFNDGVAGGWSKDQVSDYMKSFNHNFSDPYYQELLQRGDNGVPSPGSPTQPTPPPTGTPPPNVTQPPGTPPPGTGTPTPPNPGPGGGLGGTQGPPYRDPFEYNYDELAPPDRGTIDWLDLTFSGGPLHGVEDKDPLGGEYLYPGEFSPWGSNEFPGNNSDFYAKQFQRMLSNTLRWQDAYAGTQPPGMPGYEAPQPPGDGGDPFDLQPTPGLENPPEPGDPDYVPPTNDPDTGKPYKPGEGNTVIPPGPGGAGYTFNNNFELSRGMTNQEVVAAMGDIFDKEEMAAWNRHFKKNPDSAANTNWSTASGPEKFLANLLQGNQTGANLERYQKLFNNLYVKHDTDDNPFNNG